jgi:hypothetical protein
MSHESECPCCKKTLGERKALREANAELRAGVRQSRAEWAEEKKRAREAEDRATKLQAALRQIASLCNSADEPYAGWCSKPHHDAHQIARRALEKP